MLLASERSNHRVDQMSAMSNRTVLVDNNTWNNTHIATVGRALASSEEKAYPIMEVKIVRLCFCRYYPSYKSQSFIILAVDDPSLLEVLPVKGFLTAVTVE